MSDSESKDLVSATETNGHKEEDEANIKKVTSPKKLSDNSGAKSSGISVKKEDGSVKEAEVIDVDNGDSKTEDDEEKDDVDDADEKSDGDSEGEDEELQPGLLERPVILEEGSKRQRKKVERMETTSATVSKALEIVDGKGTKLGDLPNVEFHINRTLATDLKLLHRIAFGKQGTLLEVKKNLRKFSGFPFIKDSSEYNKRAQVLKSQTIKGLKTLCLTLDLERGGTKEVLMDRLLAFFMKPVASGKGLPKSKRKKSKGKKKETSKSKAKKTPSKKPSSPKKAAKSKEEVDDSDEEEDEEEESEDSCSDADEESEEEVEAPPKKKAKPSTPAKSTPAKKKESKAAKKTTPKSSVKKAEKKTPKKSPAKKATKRPAPPSDSSEDSDDEPLEKKVSKPPTDDELKEVIKKILDGANLEEITMKTVCRKVYDKYPDFDLVPRKDFIKSTVKQIIR